VTVLSIIRDCLHALLHASVRHDGLTRVRHLAFVAPRLLGSFASVAAFPVYLAVRGAGMLEIAAFAWLIVPVLLSWFLSRIGRHEAAHVLSSLALSSLVTAVAMITGGISSFAAVWLILVPLEAALSASRRVVAFASVLALSCASILILMGHLDVLPAYVDRADLHGSLAALGIASASLYAVGLAFGAESLARASVSLLLQEEERYRLLARNMSDVISRHGKNGAVRFVSPAAEALLGAPIEQLLGHGLFDRVHVADRPAYLKALSDAARGGGACSVEFRLRQDPSPTGEGGLTGPINFIWVELRCRLLERVSKELASSEAEVVGVMRDVTERKMQEQALDLARSAAETADAAKTRFLATMSHELRTPLNAIIGFSEMISQEGALMLDAARRTEYARLINESGQHLLSMVNGILDMSKMESGNFEISLEPFAPRQALIDCCNLLALKACENGIDLAIDAPKELPVITGDPRAFKQIVLNLVSNAIKFTERGGRVTVLAHAQGARLVLRVTDTGVGIAPDDLKRIGDPFFQAGKTYQRRHEGTGLGLSIVKSLVSLHAGEMTVQSRVGEGTSVTVVLPVMASNPQARQHDSNIAMLNPVLRSTTPNQTVQVKKRA